MEKSQAKKIKTLFTKQKKLLWNYYKAVQFKEPCLLLLKRNREVEFYENATKGEFTFKHSDGTDRTIYLITSQKYKFPYLSSEYKGYICHEDNPFPLPEEPQITVEKMNDIIDKTLQATEKLRTANTKATGEMIVKIAIGIAIVIGAIMMYRMVIQPEPATTVITKAVPTVIQTLTGNKTIPKI